MTDKALAQLINTINNGAHQLPGMLNTMLRQYVISNYVTATIYLLLSIGCVVAIIRLYKSMDFEYANDRNFFVGIFLVILGISGGFFVLAGMEHLNNALNPIYSLIHDFK